MDGGWWLVIVWSGRAADGRRGGFGDDWYRSWEVLGSLGRGRGRRLRFGCYVSMYMCRYIYTDAAGWTAAKVG